MTSPRGGGNNINLAALWIPVMPETSQMGSEMRKAGQTAKREFEQGFNTGASPEALGQSFSSRLNASLTKEFKGFHFPGEHMFDAFSTQDNALARTVQRLQGQASSALQKYTTDYQKYNRELEKTRAIENELRMLDQRRNIADFPRMLDLAAQRTTLTNSLAKSQEKASASLDVYNGKVSELNRVSGTAGRSGQVLAGIMGGAIVLGVGAAVKGFEGFIELVGEGLHEGINLATELAKKTLEIGESYEHIGIQVHEFSSATGADFDNLNAAAERVFSTLDVAGDDIGKTMAQLSGALHASGDEVASVAGHVTELQGRFTSLKAADLASIFVAFKVPAQEADKAVASLLQSARNSHQDLGSLTAALSGDASIALQQAGLNLEQAGAFMAKVLEMGPAGTAVVGNLTTAIKDFNDEGLSFSEGMELAGTKLRELGDSAEGQKLSETLFGTSRWATAMAAVDSYLDVVKQGPEAFSATSASVDEFLDSTQTLENEIEVFKHQAADAFRPFGDAAKNAVSTGLNSVSTWFAQHKGEVIETVQNWGNKLIDFLPRLQEFSVITLRIMGDLANALAIIFAPLVTQMGIAGAGMLALTGNFTEARDLLAATGQFDLAAITGKIASTVNDFADKIEAVKIDTEAIRDGWNDAADAAQRMPTTVGTGLAPQGSAFNPTFNGGTSPGAPGAPGAPGFPAPVPGAGPGATPGGTGGPGGIFGATSTSGGAGTTESNMSLARQLFPWPESEWNAFYQLEMKEAGFDSTAKNSSSGAFGMGQFLGHEHDAYAAGYSTDPATQLKTMYQYIADRYGTPSAAWAQYYQHPKGEGYYATGGGVMEGARNRRWDNRFNTAGRDLPFLSPSFDSGPGDHSWWHISGGGGGGFEFGGNDPKGRSHFALGGGPRGTDTVPAWLTPGEYVWDTKTVEDHGWLIKALHNAPGLQGGGWAPDDLVVDPGNPIQPNMYSSMAEYLHAINLASFLGSIAPHHDSGGSIRPVHPGGFGPDDFESLEEYRQAAKLFEQIAHISDQGYQAGGLVRYFQGGGAVDDVAGTNANIQGIDQIAKGFGLQLTAGKSGHGTHVIDGAWHDSGSAGDFSNGTGNTPEMLAFAMYMFEHYGSSLAEIIYSDPRMTKLIKDGRVVDPSFYGADTLAGHTNHVHIAARAETQMADMSPGTEQLTQGLIMPGGPGMSPGGPGSTPRNGPALPGVPGQYGGYGAYNAQTYDQMINAQQAVTDAQDRAADLDHQITNNQQRIDEINRQLAEIDTPKLGPLGRPLVKTPEEIKADDDKRRSLNSQLDDATYALTTSQRERGQQDGKISEAQRKQLESYYAQPKGTKAPKATGVEAAGQFGGAFLSGIAQELGFGDILDKPPWEWGAVKLATGLASWGLGTANAWADEIGKGHTGVTGYGAIPGYDDDKGWGGGASMFSGLLGGMGLNIPKPNSGNISAGPNVVQTQPGPGFGAPPGPPPGPVVAGDYMPIHVSPNVDPRAILGPVQEQRNANNANSFTHSGGFPP